MTRQADERTRRFVLKNGVPGRAAGIDASRRGHFVHISAPIVQNPSTGLPEPKRPGVTYEPGGLMRKTRRLDAVDERRAERKRLWREATGGLPNRMRGT